MKNFQCHKTVIGMSDAPMTFFLKKNMYIDCLPVYMSVCNYVLDLVKARRCHLISLNCHVGAGNQRCSSGKATTTLNF